MKHPRIPWPALAVVVLVPLIYVVVLGSNGEPTRRAVELLRAVADVVHSAPSRLDTGAGTMTVTGGQAPGGTDRGVACGGVGGDFLGAPGHSARRGVGGGAARRRAARPGQCSLPGCTRGRGTLAAAELLGHPRPGSRQLGGVACVIQCGRPDRHITVPPQNRPEQSDRGVRSFGQPPVNPGPVPDRGVDVT